MGGQELKLTADTNVLVRAVTGDDARQSKIAQAALSDAEAVVVTLAALCELVWVLSRGHKIALAEVAEAIRRLVNSANVVVNRPAVEAGLAILSAGGDFADGVIAFEGRFLGADAFVSFDAAAVRLLQKNGSEALLLA